MSAGYSRSIVKNNLPDFRIAHQPVTESYSGSMSGREAVTVFFCDSVHVGRRACLYSIAFEAWFPGDAPAVMDAVEVFRLFRWMHARESLTCIRQILFLTWTIGSMR